jgi:hypothetical protein
MVQQEYFYKITDLHNLANRESVYGLDSIDTEEGAAMTDRHVLGMDEEDFFKRMLKSAAVAVFKRIHRRGRGVDASYQWDVEREGVPGYVTFTLLYPDNFDSNLLEAVDTYILDSLIYHVLSSWFTKTRRNVHAEDYKQQYNDTIGELKSSIEMRTGVKRRSVFWDKYYLNT